MRGFANSPTGQHVSGRDRLQACLKPARPEGEGVSRHREPALRKPGSSVPAIMVAMPTAEIYTLLLAGLLVAGVLWVLTRFIDRD